MTRKIPSVLVVAGSDSSGGAGIQADIKTIMALGGYAATAITALTAQNTTGVTAIHPVPGEFVARQMQAVLDDLPIGAIKTGMLGSRDVVASVAGVLGAIKRPPPLIIDPVIIATSGDRLMDEGAFRLFCKALIPKASLATPNIPEAEALLGRKLKTASDLESAARDIRAMGPEAVLVTGGHGTSETINDVLVWGNKVRVFTSKRIKTRHTHGTGCTLSAAIALGLASGLGLEKAVETARRYVLRAIENAPGMGQGHGPLGHALGKKLFDL